MTRSAPGPQLLVPFGDDPAAAPFRLEATAHRQGASLQLHYDLRGPLETLRLPAPAQAPERRDGLWEGTCFEAFLAEAGAEGYRELNLSPSGHWNLYRLNGYRRGLRPDPLVEALPFQRTEAADHLQLELTLDLTPFALAQAPLELALTTVLQHSDGSCSFLALTHPGAEADFHRRDGFLLRL
ncbi:DOMON-like domain-containing protein [Cyanobium sp. FGCU-52]|nr:DOMON-like domain-containing protein [Cyanobium sp. FGCU52]